ncbi:hypothetical protein [Leptothrix ochracea]|uniref:hypothetical protein n=1 Tax=Leptothrix ochracea TaxID=735331 RepID=UPI0034E1A295
MSTRRISLAALMAVALAAALSGCASWTQPVGRYDRPAADMSYLYGDFTVAGPESTLGLYSTLGLVLKCTDGASYAIRFRRTPHGQQIMPIKPSTCSIKELVFVNVDNVEQGRKPFGLKYTNDLVLATGTAYYLGDLTGEATTARVDGNMIRSNWRVTGLADNYDKTTTSLKVAFPNFAGLPTQNLMPPLPPVASGDASGAERP